MYPWWQCLLFFCAISCCDAYGDYSLSNNSLNFQTIGGKSTSKTLLKLLWSLDVQHPGNQIPFWKLEVVSDALRRSSILDQLPLPRPHKWYNDRLVKRAVETPDKFMIAFRAAIKEAVSQYMTENKVSARSEMVDLWSRVGDNTGNLPSDVEVHVLKSIGSRLKDTFSESVHQTQPSQEHATAELVQPIQPVTEPLLISSPEGTSVDSLTEQFPSTFQSKLKIPESVTTFPSWAAQSFHSSPPNAEKSKTNKEVTTTGSSSNTINLSPLISSGSQSSETPKFSSSITKDPFTEVTNPALDNSTLGNIPISKNVNSSALPSTKKYPTNPDLVTGTMAEGLLTSEREMLSQIKYSTFPIQHNTPQTDHTPSHIFMFSNPSTKNDLSHRISEVSRLSSLPTNGKLSDPVTSSKEKIIPSLKMESTTENMIRTSVLPIKSDFPTTHIPKSTDTETPGNTEDKEEPTNTPRTPDISTLSSPQLFTSTEGNFISTETTSFETTHVVNSTVTPLSPPLHTPACILKVRSTTTTMQTPHTEQTTYENDRTGLVTIKTSHNPNNETSTLSPTELSSSVSLSPFTDSYSTEPKEASNSVPLHLIAETHFPESTKLDPTGTFSSSTDAFSVSTEPTDPLQTAMDVDSFHDAIDENTKPIQITSGVTSTQSSTFLPSLFSNLRSRTHPWKSASPFIQTVRSTVLQNAETSQGFKSNPTTHVQSHSSDHMTAQSQAIPSVTHVDSTVSHSVTSNLSPFLTISQSRSQMTETSSRLWNPLSSGIVPSKASTSIIHTKSSATKIQGFNSVSAKSSTFYSSAHVDPRREAISSTTDLKSMISQSVTSNPPLNPFFTVSQHRSDSTTMSPASSIFYSSTYITSQSQVIPHITHMKSEVSQSVTTSPEIWKLHSSVPPSESVPFTTPPLRPSSDVFPPKSTSGDVMSKSATSGAFLISDTPRARTERNSRVIIVTKRKSSTTTPKYSQKSETMSSLIHENSTFPGSVISTSTLKPPFTISRSTTKAMTRTTTTRISTNSTETLAFKAVIPQATNVIPAKNTSIPTMGRVPPEMQKTPKTTPSSTPAVVTMPLTFHLTGVPYSDQLSNNKTEEYKSLETEVLLVLNKIFATKYQQEFVKVQILGFSKGSVVVNSKVIFGNSSPAPSGSDIVRTILSDDYATKNNYFNWKINASTVESEGYTPNNLEQESLSISFVVLHFGFIAISQNDQEKQNYLRRLQKEILSTVNSTFQVTNISFSQIRDLHGDLDVRGILYMTTSTFTNVDVLLSTMLPLANESLDLCSITVEGIQNELKVYPFNIRITNMQFAVSLLDMASTESQKLSKDLSREIGLALRDKSLLQVVVREFYSGSVMCKGDLIYQFPAPGSGEVLRQFLQALKSDGTLGSSAYKIDSQSVTIEDSTSSPYNEYMDFPGFAVAIIVMCGLSILIFPLLVFVCYKTRMLGHRKKATIRHRHDADQQSHRFEMDNRAFRASIEQP